MGKCYFCIFFIKVPLLYCISLVQCWTICRKRNKPNWSAARLRCSNTECRYKSKIYVKQSLISGIDFFHFENWFLIRFFHFYFSVNDFIKSNHKWRMNALMAVKKMTQYVQKIYSTFYEDITDPVKHGQKGHCMEVAISWKSFKKNQELKFICFKKNWEMFQCLYILIQIGIVSACCKNTNISSEERFTKYLNL